LLLIRAQPNDDHDLHTLLVPDGCPMPCFMGIRPGVTTVTDAVTLLEASGWVNQADIHINSRFNIVRLEWYWNGLQPEIFDGGWRALAVATRLPGYNQETGLDESHRVITGISVITTIPYGKLRLLLGRGTNKPDYVVSKSYINPRITAVYSDYNLVALSALMHCPVSLTKFWNKHITLQIGYTFVDDIVHFCRGVT
jgi:hypothetical protein